jgi:hypothetical protein
MSDEKQTIFTLIESLNNQIAAGTLTPEEITDARDEIKSLQMSVLLGDIFND